MAGRHIVLLIYAALKLTSALVYLGNVTASPSAAQLAWEGYEVGVMITFNLQTFCLNPSSHNASAQRCQESGTAVPTWDFVTTIDLPDLDTDTWMAAAASFGARYAVLVVDHMTGFALWPTKQHNLSIAATRYKGGHGDVLAEFLASCEKLGIAPGFFYSTHFNWFLGVNDYAVGWPRMYGGPPLTQAQYEDVVLAQLAELAGYQATMPAPMTEIWFDGGVNTVITPRVGPAVRSLFPTAVCHSCANFTQDGGGGAGNGYGLRWMGNEEGDMPLPSWGASSPGGTPYNGAPGGSAYIPPSCDTVLSEHLWFWTPGYAQHLRSTCALVGVYLTSVGRASNLILNMAPNTTGGLDAGDVNAYAALGAAVACLWRAPLAESAGRTELDGNGTAVFAWPVRVPLLSGQRLALHIQEDVAATGQRIGAWGVDLCVVAGAGAGGGSSSNPVAAARAASAAGATCAGGTWMPLLGGVPPAATASVGHKRILEAAAPSAPGSIAMASLRFTAATAYDWQPQLGSPIALSRVAVYDWSHVQGACVPSDCALPGY